jgi:hypothetical protein
MKKQIEEEGQAIGKAITVDLRDLRVKDDAAFAEARQIRLAFYR